MERKSQIERLATAWVALGDGRRMYWDDPECLWVFVREQNGDYALCAFEQEGSDTLDATPCLALLRDVKGEDVDIVRRCVETGRVENDVVELDYNWEVRLLDCSQAFGTNVVESLVSRLDATALVLESEAKELNV